MHSMTSTYVQDNTYYKLFSLHQDQVFK